MDILDKDDEITGEDLENMEDEELGDLIVDILENITENPGDTTVEVKVDPGAYDENGAMTSPFDQVYPELIENGLVAFDDETLLIKMRNSRNGEITAEMAAAGIAVLEVIVPMEETSWYEAKLVAGTDATVALAALRELSYILVAEYNYAVETAQIDSYKPFPDDMGFGHNEHHKDQWHMHHCGIPDGMEAMTTNGGSSSVIVAVIDTGVDIDHEDLAQNIWVNVNEIPDNGLDDDNNGYVDDYYGVNIITGNGNGDDDNGHGTHVAGIIAAQNNNLGTVGIAYNVKIMPIKAASASGYLHQSDIAKAILYAYENGAEVINMSFGGTSCSIAVQDALAVAYNRCVLVASAGNDGAPNEFVQGWATIPNYPAALTYVLGVMSVDQNGVESSFTNWDVTAFNGVEYELYAPGDSIMSTLPDNRYGILSGTSMAAPVVSAIAAILRSEFTDRDLYPTKFIYGQLCSTSEYHATCLDPKAHGPHNLPQIVDLYAALTKLPKPDVNLQDSALFDTEGFTFDTANKNNGDGVIDAGETIALGLTLRNRWGMSKDTIVTLDTLSGAGIPDPYITIHNPEVRYGSVGTYSTQDCGRIYTDEIVTGWEDPFYITVSPDCPNDYIFRINVTITSGNALDEKDTAIYVNTGVVELTVRNGYVVPNLIDEDAVWTADNLYIIPNGTVIAAGTTVRVEPGTRIQFWSDDPQDPYASNYIAYLRVDGNFFVEGTKENPVYIYPSELMSDYVVAIGTGNSGVVALEYAELTNFGHANVGGVQYAYGCVFRNNYSQGLYSRRLSSGKVEMDYYYTNYKINRMENCVFYKLDSWWNNQPDIWGSAYGCMFVESPFNLNNLDVIQDCVFLINNHIYHNQSGYEISASLTADSFAFGVNSGDVKIYYRPETGTTYVAVKGMGNEMIPLYIRELEGQFVVLETAEEANWLKNRLPSSTGYVSIYDLGIRYDFLQDAHVWADGTPVTTLAVPEGYTSLKYYAGTLFNGSHPGCGNNCYNHDYWSVYEIPGPIYVTDIRLQEYEILLDMDSYYLINAQTKPVPMGAENLIFESRDESVVTVDETGRITPVGLGTTEVYVYCDDRAVSNYITVTVAPYLALESIAPSVDYAEVAVGMSADMRWKLIPLNTTRRNLTFISSNESVATVDIYGRVTGVGSGRATITAISTELDAEGNPIQASFTVKVYNPIESLDLQDNMILNLSDGIVALPTPTYSAGGEPIFTWRSLDTDVASIRNGRLVLHRVGTTTIEVTDQRTGITASCLVWVLEEDMPAIKKVQISGSYSKAFVLLEDGRLFSWGGGSAGREPKLERSDVVDFDSYNNYIKIVTTDGCLMGSWFYESGVSDWGYYQYLPSNLVNQGVAGVAAVGSNNYYNDTYIIWLENGDAYAHGDGNEYGQLGVGSTESIPTWSRINLTGVISIVCNGYTTYFLTASGQLYMAGGESTVYLAPTLIAEGIAELQADYCSAPFVVTQDGRVAYVSGTNLTYYSVDMDVVSWRYNYGLGIRDGLVYQFDDMAGEITLVPGITNAVDVWAGMDAYYIETADGLLYGFGSNNNYQMAGVTTDAYVNEPVMIPLIRPAGEVLSITDKNLVDGMLLENELIVTFNKELLSGQVYLYADGNQVLFRSEYRDLNKLVVVPNAGYEVGKSYQLKILAGNLHGFPYTDNPSEINISFTYEPDFLMINEDQMILDLADGTAELPEAVYRSEYQPYLKWYTLDPTVATVEEGVLVLKNIGTTTLVLENVRNGAVHHCEIRVTSEQVGVKKLMPGDTDGAWFALLEDGRLFHWGGADNTVTLPQLVLTDVKDFTVANDTYVRVLHNDGTLATYDYYGDCFYKVLTLPALPEGEYAGMAATGQNNTIVWLADGTAYAFGADNAKGQLGLGHTDPATAFTKIELTGVVSVAMTGEVQGFMQEPSEFVTDEMVSNTTYFLLDTQEIYFTGSMEQYNVPTKFVAINYDSAKYAELYNSSVDHVAVRLDDGSCYELTRRHEIIVVDEETSYEVYRGYVGGTFSHRNEGILVGDTHTKTIICIRENQVCIVEDDGERIEYPTIIDPVGVWCYDGTYFAWTAEGILYGFGNNANGQLAGATAEETVEQPVIIDLHGLGFDTLYLTGDNTYDGILNEDELVLEFNKQLHSAYLELYAGEEIVEYYYEIGYLNTLHIVPVDGFQAGVEYEVHFPAASIDAAPALTTTDDISFTFTYDPAFIPEVDPNTVPVIQDPPVIHDPIWDYSVFRFYWSSTNFADRIMELHRELNWNYRFVGNAILNQISTDFEVEHWLRILGSSYTSTTIPFGGNFWGTTNEQAIGLQIVDYSDFPDYAQVGYKPFLLTGPENTFPFVVDVTVLNKAGEDVYKVGNEEITVRITFNRDMDTTIPLTVRFGSYYPYGDYQISGEYVDERTWEGKYTLNTLIENGYQYFSISDGRTADGKLDLYTDHGRFLFEIDTTAAQALIMQGYATDEGIQLSWQQDDFDTLMGYNIYRSTSEDGYYQRVNTSVIPFETREFFDNTVEPGVVYYYNFTVVKTDLTESVPSGKISIMSKDTMAPDIYHSPVYNATTGSNLIISATVTDNLTISTVRVYYRTVGQTQWKVAVMNKLNDKYSAIIPASDVTTAGIEYYIEAFDGVSYTYKGSAQVPYTVTVQAALDPSARGDVNGDGRISNLDALMLLQAINDLLNLDAEQFARADLNGDGVLTAAEALRILQYVNGTVGDLIMP